jgi:hypothetical protein
MTFVIVLSVDDETHQVIGPFASMNELTAYAEERGFALCAGAICEAESRENPIMSDSGSSADQPA